MTEIVAPRPPGAGPLIADGAVGEHLRRSLPHHPLPPEELNLSRPELVRAVHGEFLAAGAMLHRTNTRHAQATALAGFGLEERCEAANNSAAALARAVVGPERHLMGAIGQIDAGHAGAPAAPERERAYGEQVVYLSDTGVTFFLLEHFTLLEEARRVLRIVRSASDAPVLAQLRFDDQGRTADGATAEQAAVALVEAGAGALGIGCGPAPAAWPPILAALLAPGVPVSVLLGVAAAEVGAPYPGAPALSPRAFAQALAPLAAQGITILGGCCGAGPEHIRALASELATD